MVIDIPEWPELHVVNSYYVVGEGLCERNVRLMAEAAKAVEGRGLAMGAADWNMVPSAVRESGWPITAGATLMVPRKPAHMHFRESSQGHRLLCW